MVFWRRTEDPTPPEVEIRRCCACSAAVGDADALLVIYTLAKRAAALDVRFRDIGTDAWTLDTLYVFSRYPFGTPFKAPKESVTDVDDATAAVTVASQVVDLASEAMPKASGA